MSVCVCVCVCEVWEMWEMCVGKHLEMMDNGDITVIIPTTAIEPTNLFKHDTNQRPAANK